MHRYSASTHIVLRHGAKTMDIFIYTLTFVGDHAIPSRPNTGTLAASTTKAKTTAARSVPATTKTGKGVMKIPPMANAEAIRISATDDTPTHKLGREDQRQGLVIVICPFAKCAVFYRVAMTDKTLLN